MSCTSPPLLAEPRFSVDDCTIGSAFQPLFSLAHRRLVGHEALLRATGPNGLAIAPKTLFAACTSVKSLARLDQRCRRSHLQRFANAGRASEWLFLNVDASLFVGAETTSAARTMRALCDDAGIAPSQVVIEVLEDAFHHQSGIERQIEALKEAGFLIGLDDFGAGDSNFDRVLKLAPQIVKLDRGVVSHAATDATARRVTTQMVSLLHECGALVVMEGIECREEALVALDSDVDFVQGYYFGRPAPDMLPLGTGGAMLDDTWHFCDQRWASNEASQAAHIAPYREALASARERLQAGDSFEAACAGFLALDDAEVCYLLDARGHQIGQNVFRRLALLDPGAPDRFAPLRDAANACWSRRPYFRRAAQDMSRVHVTRPYMTIQSLRMCITFSASFWHEGEMKIICGDLAWGTETG